ERAASKLLVPEAQELWPGRKGEADEVGALVASNGERARAGSRATTYAVAPLGVAHVLEIAALRRFLRPRKSIAPVLSVETQPRDLVDVRRRQTREPHPIVEFAIAEAEELFVPHADAIEDRAAVDAVDGAHEPVAQERASEGGSPVEGEEVR